MRGMGQYITTVFNNLPVRGKLMLALFVITGLLLSVAALTILGTELVLTSRIEHVDNRILADILARNSSAAVDFNDRQSALETLESLHANPEVIAAHIILPDGRLFASYVKGGEDGHLALVRDGEDLKVAPGVLQTLVNAENELIPADRHYKVVLPFQRGGRLVSTVVLITDLNDVMERLNSVLLVTGALLFGSLLFCFLISSWLQRLMTGPLLDLEKSIQQVGREQDYSLRVDVVSNDEIGNLSRGFNLMLEQIALRDQELARFRNKLEEMVGDRTAELLEAKERAEEENRVKSRFLATLSHDVRSPLIGLLGIAEILLRLEQTEEQRQHLETIRRSGAALLAIMDDLLDIAKFETGTMTLSITSLDVPQIIDDVVALFSPLCRDSEVRLSWSADTSLPSPLWGDGAKLQRILMNLVQNARKFTRQGEISVSVQTVAKDEREVLLRFQVRDTGIGIPAGEQEKIFRDYYQADRSSPLKEEGVGLGLGIVTELVTTMGGELGLVSSEGEGSTFWFTLPFARDVATGVSAWTSPGTLLPGEESQAATFPLSVLLVEDNQVVRQLAEEMLTSLGCSVETARNGIEALRCREGKWYDLLLMDCQMQDMDGFSATRRIRELEQAAGTGEHCPIVALTAFSTAHDMALCRDAGMDDYLRKPFNRRELAALLERCTTGEYRGFLPTPALPADDTAPRPAAASGAMAPAMTFRDYARRLVENEEGLRKRLATELHDEIGRAMATLSLTLGMIDASLPENTRSSFLAERVDDAQKLIESASRTIGNIMFGLRPSVLDDFGLVSTIRRHAVLFEKKTGVVVDLQVVDETGTRLLPPQELAMYRVYQEAMLNASLHGDPSCITVTIHCSRNRTTLQISDDGCGFDPLHPTPSVSGSGWGLMLMRERIEAVGGTFHLASLPGEGTIITVTIEESV